MCHTLLEVVTQLDRFDEEATIFAKPIGDQLKHDSPAAVIIIPDEELALKTVEIAKKHCPGMKYVLEVFLAKEAVKVWSLWRDQRTPTAEQATDAVVYYSTHDAYLPTDGT